MRGQRSAPGQTDGPVLGEGRETGLSAGSGVREGRAQPGHTHSRVTPTPMSHTALVRVEVRGSAGLRPLLTVQGGLNPPPAVHHGTDLRVCWEPRLFIKGRTVQ